jgi:hypothetical protein
MPEEIEKKIQRLTEIRTDQKTVKYLTAFEAYRRINFLLALIDELTEALFKIHAAVQEGKKLDPNINPGSKHDPDTLAS